MSIKANIALQVEIVALKARVAELELELAEAKKNGGVVYVDNPDLAETIKQLQSRLRSQDV